ncbi:MAG: allophanate hydrolase [Flavobacteriaceae bacterium]|nr:allophanate hydrolase [Flavobacteriaceae bacterium]|tara:strand:+ start:171 stop:1025 length:855 start_codon:yes stop_codon:yes gene_type:complete
MIRVVKGGLYTTVQDAGRYGYRNMGVPVSGAMDSVSAAFANKLVGNSMNDAVLEITLLGPTLKFEEATRIAVAGAPFKVLLNAAEMVMNTPISVKKNDVLTIERPTKGMRCYMAVAGGLQTPELLQSRSFYPNITETVKLADGDVLPLKKSTSTLTTSPLSVPSLNFSKTSLQVYPGPEFEALSLFQQQGLLEQMYTVSAQSNRMAYLLTCSATLSAKEIHTAPVQPGTVQLTPSGKIIVLMRDAQVTGGYARIFQLTEQSLNVLSQKRGGETIKFQKVTVSGV